MKYCLDECLVFCHACCDWNVDRDKMIPTVYLECNQSQHLTIICQLCKNGTNREKYIQDLNYLHFCKFYENIKSLRSKL
jgi:hypothetical protein